ncbi:MAG: hypothetical protein QXL27_00620 [Candidatus Bathyarchaeia archaeon]
MQYVFEHMEGYYGYREIYVDLLMDEELRSLRTVCLKILKNAS